jgi:N-acetylglucosamine kinase-like BadF-type ATPase
MTEQVFIGIDGGGSKTAGAIADVSGRLRGSCLGGRSAIVGDPLPESLDVLKGAVDSLLDRAKASLDDVACCGIGLNGIDFEDERPRQHAAIAGALGIAPERMILVNDGIAALWGATPAPAAGLLQHGSGFTSAFRAQFGGETLFDHLNVGRTFDLRHELLSLVARMIDGRIAPTPLKEAVLAHLEVADEGEYAEAVYRGRLSPAKRLTTPPLIYSAWEQGDAGAAVLVERAADDYALAAAGMVRRIGQPAAEVAFGGGVIDQAPAAFWDLLAARVRRLCPEAATVRPRLSPAVGAVIMAAHACGVEPGSYFGLIEQEQNR